MERITALFVVAILFITLVMLNFTTEPDEVVCFDPIWRETGYAVVSAECELKGKKITVSLVD